MADRQRYSAVAVILAAQGCLARAYGGSAGAGLQVALEPSGTAFWAVPDGGGHWAFMVLNVPGDVLASEVTDIPADAEPGVVAKAIAFYPYFGEMSDEEVRQAVEGVVGDVASLSQVEIDDIVGGGG